MLSLTITQPTRLFTYLEPEWEGSNLSREVQSSLSSATLFRSSSGALEVSNQLRGSPWGNRISGCVLGAKGSVLVVSGLNILWLS